MPPGEHVRAHARSAAVWTLAVAAAVAPACTKTDEISFNITLPGDAREGTQWIELAAYDVPNCPSIGQLSGGLPRGGAIRRVGFKRGDAPPKFALDKGTYAFAATARNTQCEVLAAGCTAIEVPGAETIDIALKPTEVRGGACEAGSICQNAQCVPAPSTDGTGEGCTLETVGAGPLEALEAKGTSVGKPIIAAVADGFVIAYTQQANNILRVTTMKVASSGGWVPAEENGSVPYNRYGFQPSCPENIDTKGIGLLFDAPDSETGLIVAPRSSKCPPNDKGERPLALIYQIQPDGKLVSTDGAGPQFDRDYNSHVISNHPIARGGHFVHILDGQTYLEKVSAAGFKGTAIPVGGPPPHLDAWVASSFDASGKEIGYGVLVLAETSITDDAGTVSGGTELRLQVAAGSQPLSDELTKFPSRFGALGMGGSRFFVLSSGDLTSPLLINSLDLGRAQPNNAVPVQPSGEGQTLAADVAIDGERLFVASVLTTGVNVSAFEQIQTDTGPKLLKERQLAREPRITPFMGGIFQELRDGYVAIAAHGARVGVVWVTGERVSAGENVGGWAVLACR